MTEARTMSRDLQEDILSTVRKSQDAVVEAIQVWTSKIQSFTPDLPDLTKSFTDHLPKPHELVASAYDFAEQLLASQRKFAEDALNAMSPPTAVRDEAHQAPAKKNGSAAK
jgi:hypothetical protein